LKKVFLGEGIMIDVPYLNHLIEGTEHLFLEIFQKHEQFFKKVIKKNLIFSVFSSFYQSMKK